jgi:hypothetical protein
VSAKLGRSKQRPYGCNAKSRQKAGAAKFVQRYTSAANLLMISVLSACIRKLTQSG